MQPNNNEPQDLFSRRSDLFDEEDTLYEEQIPTDPKIIIPRSFLTSL